MYQRKDKKLQRERVYKALFVIIVVFTGGLIGVVLTFFGSWKDEFDIFFNGFDVESSLIPDEYINESFLSERAMQFEQLLGTYHIPFNIWAIRRNNQRQ